MFKFKKKGDPISTLIDLVIGLVVIGIVIAISLLIMSNVRTNPTVIADNYSLASVNQTVTAIGGIPGWLPLIVLVIIGSVLLSLILFFRQRA